MLHSKIDNSQGPRELGLPEDSKENLLQLKVSFKELLSSGCVQVSCGVKFCFI